jgi:prepilin-type N-terminal cleavage/methylation domain-containing protein
LHLTFTFRVEMRWRSFRPFLRGLTAPLYAPALILLAARGRSRLPSTPVTLPNLEPYELQILKMAKSFGVINEKAGKFYERGAVIKRPWARFNGNGSGPSCISIPAMKTKGFTLVELVVACTLLLMLSTIATTSTFNFVQATANLKAQYNNIQNIMALHEALVHAKMNYATDLALETNINEAKTELQHWNLLAQQHDSADLILRLITPDPILADLPLAPLNPGSRSYLPTSRNGVQITDVNSLLKAYQLTDNGTTTGNIVATIAVGPMLDLTSGMRPTLPIIDWKSGTPQEIEF